jgi:DNA-binding CsgD family transcriptional regulator
LLTRVSGRLTLLAAAGHTMSARHRSLRAAIEWSYDLLIGEEQAAFRRLALLPGGFDESAALALCADLGLTDDELWRRVMALATKSVVAPDRLPGSGRFQILHSLRVFGTERLRAAGELAGAQDRLLGWAMELARLLAQERGLPGPLRRRVMDERHNLRLAVDVARETVDGRYPWLVIAFVSACMSGGDLNEAVTLLEGLLDEVGEGPAAAAVRAAALVELSWVRRVRGEYEASRRCGEEGLALARQVADRAVEARALNKLVPTYRCLGDAERAIAIKHQEVDSVRATGTRQELAMVLGALGWDLLATGQVEAAATAVDEAMVLLGEEDSIFRWGPIRHSAGSVALLAGDLEQAVVHFTIALANEPANVEDVPYNLEGLALVAGRRGAAERTLRLLAAASAARRAGGVAAEPWWAALCQDAGEVARHQVPKARAAAAVAEGGALSAEDASVYAILDKLPEAVSRTRGTGLTRREYEVAKLVAQGLTTAQIAARLEVSGRTVATHVASIRTKLDLPTRGHITAWVARQIAERGPDADEVF